MNLYKSVVTSAIESKKQCHKWFENFLFGPLFEVDEEDTEIEADIAESLFDFFAGSAMNKSKENLIELFEMMKSCKDYYKLLTPKIKYAYRGSTKPFRTLKKPVKTIKSDLAPEQGFNVYKLKYEPRDILQSWSADIEIAASFAIGSVGIKGKVVNMEHKNKLMYRNRALKRKDPMYLKKLPVPIIYKAKVDDSFFGSTELGNKFFSLVEGNKQDEIFRLGKSIKCEAFVPVKWLEWLEGLDEYL